MNVNTFGSCFVFITSPPIFFMNDDHGNAIFFSVDFITKAKKKHKTLQCVQTEQVKYKTKFEKPDHNLPKRARQNPIPRAHCQRVENKKDKRLNHKIIQERFDVLECNLFLILSRVRENPRPFSRLFPSLVSSASSGRSIRRHFLQKNESCKQRTAVFNFTSHKNAKNECKH